MRKRLMVPVLPGIEEAVEFVNGQSDRYRALCGVVVGILERVKVDSEEKHELLADVSDILDGLPASDKSGFVRVPKKH